MIYNNAIVQRLRIVAFLILDKIRPCHVTGHLQKLETQGRAHRTGNLSPVCLKNMLKSARVDGFIKSLPVGGIPFKT
jgi:hypothetical protein